MPTLAPATVTTRGLALLVLTALFVASTVLVGIEPAAPASISVAPSTSTATPGASPGSLPATIEVAPGFGGGAGIREVGPLASTTPLNVAVGLGLTNPSGLTAYLTALYTPGSLAYHRYASVSRLAREFGPDASDLAAATAYFRGYGLSVATSPDHLVLDVQGPAANVGAAFHTSFVTYARAGGTFVSHPTPARLPAGIPWTGAYGLGNVTPLVPSNAGATPIEVGVSPDAACSGAGYLLPCQVDQAYNFSSLLAAGKNGTGTTVGVVDAYDGSENQSHLENDLASFDAEFGLSAPEVKYLYPVPTTADLNASATGWGVEESLDLEWAHAMAPGAAVDMTFSPNSGVGLYEAVDYLVSHAAVNVLSLSWGEPDVGVYNAYSGPCATACNASTDGSYDILSPVLEFAAAEGISVFAATGDCGAADGTSGVATNYPASDPYVTGVGGTVLSTSLSGSWTSETAWSGNDSGAVSPGCENQGGSGGGFSPFPRPAWQTGEGLAPSGAARGAPDVAAIAAPGVEIVEGSRTAAVAGTSVATPIWAGIAAISDQAAGSPLGLLDPSLYAVLRSSDYASDFHEITSGNNGYSAGPGWNPVTGIGSPIVSALVPSLVQGPRMDSSIDVTLNASQDAGPAPLTVTFFVNASGGTGTYPLEGVYFGDGNASYLVHGAVSHTYPTAGVYAAQAYAFDSSANLTTSIPVAILVGGGNVLDVSLSASTSAPASGSPVQFTATASGGTAPYTYSFWFGDGTFDNGSSSASVNHTYPLAGGFCAAVVVSDSATPADGAVGAPVAIAVGGAAAPMCPTGEGPPQVIADAHPGVRDAPADFPALFGVSGGVGTTTERLVASDAYVSACGCTIFRSPGTFSVSMYVNDSAGAHVLNATLVRVAPALTATFTSSATYGPAPLSVVFRASVTGGYGPNVTAWTFGNGMTAAGPSVEATYSTPGWYWAIGQSSDAGDGNASEAFLIDVVAPGTSGAYLTATIAPAVDVPSGTTVNFSAAGVATDGARAAANVTWFLGGGGSAFAPSAARTVYAPAADPASSGLNGSLAAFFPISGNVDNVTFRLPHLFAVEASGFVPRADALVLADAASPFEGSPPLAWSGTAFAAGVGATSVAWDFGDGSMGSGDAVTHTYAVGVYTSVVRATDAFGDLAVDAHSVDVTNGSLAPLPLEASVSVDSGTAPLVVRFNATASDGTLPYLYEWEFGDGGSANAANASHTYTTAGTFVADISVHDAAGRSAERTFTIVVTAAAPRGAAPLVPLWLPPVLAGCGAGIVLAVALGRRRPPGTPPSP